MINFYIYLVLINALTFAAFGIDKGLAIAGVRRIPERVLLTLPIIGGGLGAAISMLFFHHKTSKPKFRYTATLSFLAYLGFIIYRTWGV